MVTCFDTDRKYFDDSDIALDNKLSENLLTVSIDADEITPFLRSLPEGELAKFMDYAKEQARAFLRIIETGTTISRRFATSK